MCAGMYEELRAFPKPELHHSPFTLIRGTKILPEHVNHESGFVLHNSHLHCLERRTQFHVMYEWCGQ